MQEGQTFKVVIPIEDAYHKIEALIKKGDYKNALKRNAQALLRFDNDEAFLNQKGLILRQMRDYPKAAEAFRAACQKTGWDGNSAPALVNLGMCYRMMFKPHEAIEYLNKAWRRMPILDAGLALVGCLFELRQYDHAESICRLLIEKWPDAWQPRTLIYQILLAKGDWVNGWRSMDGRLMEGQWSITYESFKCPVWNGEDLTGKSLAVWTEQGAGDEICMLSLLPDFIRTYNPQKVYLMASARTRDLLSSMTASFPQIEMWIRKPAHAPETDFQAGWKELGLGVSLVKDLNEGLTGKFLRPHDEELANKVHYTYSGAQNKIVVGVSWFSTNIDAGRGKSLSFDQFRPLFQRGTQVVSLQNGQDVLIRRQTEAAPDLNMLNDFGMCGNGPLEDLAVRVAACDVVVTVSNTVAHIAGALGVETYVFVPDGSGRWWHWSQQTKNGRSVWYDSVRICLHDAANPGVADLQLQQIGADLHERYLARQTKK